jgi:hypothetical protein
MIIIGGDADWTTWARNHLYPGFLQPGLKARTVQSHGMRAADLHKSKRLTKILGFCGDGFEQNLDGVG